MLPLCSKRAARSAFLLNTKSENKTSLGSKQKSSQQTVSEVTVQTKWEAPECHMEKRWLENPGSLSLRTGLSGSTSHYGRVGPIREGPGKVSACDLLMKGAPG